MTTAASARRAYGFIGVNDPRLGYMTTAASARRAHEQWGSWNVIGFIPRATIVVSLQRGPVKQPSLTGVKGNLGIALPIPYRRVLVHQLVHTQYAISEHAGRNAGKVGEFLIRFLDLARSSPDTRWSVYCCTSAKIDRSGAFGRRSAEGGERSRSERARLLRHARPQTHKRKPDRIPASNVPLLPPRRPDRRLLESEQSGGTSVGTRSKRSIFVDEIPGRCSLRTSKPVSRLP